MEKTFEEKMLRFEETSLRFQETVLKSLLRIEKRIHTNSKQNEDNLGAVVETIVGNLAEVSEYLARQRRHSSEASEGGRKFTRKKYK